MHKWAKEIMERVKTKVNARGIDNLQNVEIEELKHWSEVARNIAEYDYYCKIIEEMEKGNERFYSEPRIYDPNMTQYRDMDSSMGRMYYTDRNNMGGQTYRESRYERARRGYSESKKMNPTSDNMYAVEQIFDAFEDDINELKPRMTPNEKSIARNKLNNMSNMLM